MLKAIPHGKTVVRELVGRAVVDAVGGLPTLVDDSELPPLDQRPFVQLSYEEITGSELDRVLGSDICGANCVVGLPGGTKRAQASPDVLLITLSDLASKLRTVEPQLALEFDSRGTDAIMASRDMTASEYLVLGMLHCISWCDARRAALLIRW